MLKRLPSYFLQRMWMNDVSTLFLTGFCRNLVELCHKIGSLLPEKSDRLGMWYTGFSSFQVVVILWPSPLQTFPMGSLRRWIGKINQVDLTNIKSGVSSYLKCGANPNHAIYHYELISIIINRYSTFSHEQTFPKVRGNEPLAGRNFE